jgi:hypothetical protein
VHGNVASILNEIRLRHDYRRINTPPANNGMLAGAARIVLGSGYCAPVSLDYKVDFHQKHVF